MATVLLTLMLVSFLSGDETKARRNANSFYAAKRVSSESLTDLPH